MKKTISVILAIAVIAVLAAGLSGVDSSRGAGFAGGFSLFRKDGGEHLVKLSEDGKATLDGRAVEEYDYTWHADPSAVHGEVEDCPAEYYTGEAPDTKAAAYIAHDIFYLPELPEDGFRLIDYDGEREWAYYYADGENEDRIFATLPRLGSSLPKEMMSSEEEASSCPVLHIVKPGTYRLEGSWKGQIFIDLGDPGEAFSDEKAKVTVVLGGVSVDCGSVAPAFIARSAYEADGDWSSRSSGSSDVDVSRSSGVRVVIADGTVNSFSGGNVPRMLRTSLKSGQEGSAVPVQKKARKIDGAFYSYVSMAIDGGEQGTGTLNIRSNTYEGLGSELHLAVNGGNLNIKAADDGINVNEDHVSVAVFNGGTTQIYAGLGAEGDAVDSNGWIVVNGGTLIACANPRSDNGLDSEDGTEINGGTVVALGSNMGGSSYTVYVDGEMQYGSSLGGRDGFGGWDLPGEDFGGGPGIQGVPDFGFWDELDGMDRDPLGGTWNGDSWEWFYDGGEDDEWDDIEDLFEDFGRYFGIPGLGSWRRGEGGGQDRTPGSDLTPRERDRGRIGAPGRQYSSNTVIISIDPDATEEQVQELFDRYGFEVMYDYRSFSMYAVRTPEDLDEKGMSELIEKLLAEDIVTGAERDYITELPMPVDGAKPM